MNDLIETLNLDWQAYLAQQPPEKVLIDKLHQSERTGRPIGDAKFLDDLGLQLGRNLHPNKPGRPRKCLKTTDI